MANHKSSLKRIRSDKAKRLRNRYNKKTTSTFTKRLLALKDKKEAEELLPKVVSLYDKLAKRGIIHKNNASNKKSKLTKYVNSLS